MSFAHTVVEEVGLLAADERYNDLKSRVRNQIRAAVAAELDFIALSYRRFVIGRQRRRFQGTLATQANQGYDADGRPLRASLALESVMEPWPDWSPRYKLWKEKKYPPPRWFENTGTLKQKISGAAWQTWFGPIRINVERDRSRVELANGRGRFSIARIAVRAFGDITPEMLPALSTGNPKTPNPSDGRVSGLIGLIRRSDPDAAYRLAGSQATVPYRESLEPFLAFVLTRSVPTAVFSTVNHLANGTDAIGSAGRTRGRS